MAEAQNEPLVAAIEPEEPPAQPPGEGRPAMPAPGRAAGLRLGAKATVAGALAAALVWLLGPPLARPTGAVDSLGIVGLSASVSPMAAVMQSFKKPILDVEGAFSGGQCHMGPNETCSLSDMPKDKLTGVFPGGDTRCLLGDTPYLFQVIPGDRDKLLLYFAGGGACWDSVTASAQLCMHAVCDEGVLGIFDRTNVANPYKRYTVIILGYCSGDAHVGHASQTWRELKNKGKVEQRGYINARTAIEWTKKNLGDSELDSFIITGSSAGALGTQVWAKTLLEEFRYRAAAVLADSYAAIFPIGVQGAMMKDFGLCDTGLLTPRLRFQCTTGSIDVQQVFEEAMRFHPQVAFASLDSKIDAIQIAFYKAVFASRMKIPDAVLPQHFSILMASEHVRYNVYPNWVSYEVNDHQHMYLNNDVMYQTTPVGTHVNSSNGSTGKFLAFVGEKITGSEMPLVEWLAKLPVRPGGSIASQCAGVSSALPTLPPPAPLNTSFLGLLKHTLKSAVKTSVSLAGHTLQPVVHLTASQLGFAYSCDLVRSSKVFKPHH